MMPYIKIFTTLNMYIKFFDDNLYPSQLTISVVLSLERKDLKWILILFHLRSFNRKLLGDPKVLFLLEKLSNRSN